MILGREVEVARLAPAAHFRCSPTRRALRARTRAAVLGRPSCQASSSSCTCAMAASLAVELPGQFLGARQQCAGVFALALGHADGLGIRVALGAHAIGIDLRGLAAFFECGERGDVEREPAAREVGGDGGGSARSCLASSTVVLSQVWPRLLGNELTCPPDFFNAGDGGQQATDDGRGDVRHARQRKTQQRGFQRKRRVGGEPPSTPVIQKSRALSALAPRAATYIYKSPMAKEPSRFTVNGGHGPAARRRRPQAIRAVARNAAQRPANAHQEPAHFFVLFGLRTAAPALRRS